MAGHISSIADAENLEAISHRLNLLLHRLLEQGVIPFLGAGISMDACGDVAHRIADMRTVLVEKLNSHETMDVGHENVYSCTFNEQKNSVSFDQVASLYSSYYGQAKLCEDLKIEEFQNLTPTFAHRYLAYLAREGLIHEIFTTNYDTCMEQAFCSSFESEDGNKLLQVITTLEEYRASAGKRWTIFSDDSVRLQLYKLNGCAKRYSEECSKQDEKYVAESILLTESQLQSHRGQPWKKDLLADRLRRSNILFTGFGANEPQVRFLALQIYEEFSKENGVSAKKSINNEKLNESLDSVLSLPNIPFIAVKESSLSFPQLQILDGFYRGHKLSFLEALKNGKVSVFSGIDARMANSSNSDGLSANLFYEWLFQSAYCRLLHRFLQKGSVFYNWLGGVTMHPGAWIAFLKSRLYSHSHLQSSFSSKQFGEFRSWLTLTEELSAPSLPIMRLLRMIFFIKIDAENLHNWYFPGCSSDSSISKRNS